MDEENRAVVPKLKTLLRGLLGCVDCRPSVTSEGSVTSPKFVSGRDNPQQCVNKISERAANLGWNDGNLMARISDCFDGEADE